MTINFPLKYFFKLLLSFFVSELSLGFKLSFANKLRVSIPIRTTLLVSDSLRVLKEYSWLLSLAIIMARL